MFAAGCVCTTALLFGVLWLEHHKGGTDKQMLLDKLQADITISVMEISITQPLVVVKLVITPHMAQNFQSDIVSYIIYH